MPSPWHRSLSSTTLGQPPSAPTAGTRTDTASSAPRSWVAGIISKFLKTLFRWSQSPRGWCSKTRVCTGPTRRLDLVLEMTFAGKTPDYWDSDGFVICDKTQDKQHLNTFRVLKNKVNAPFVGPPKSKKFPDGIKVLYYPINDSWNYDNILSLECITTNVERRNGRMLDSATTKRCAVRMGSTKLVKIE